MAILLNDAGGFPSSSRHSIKELPNGTAHNNVIVLKISSDRLCMAVSLKNASTHCPDMPSPDVSSCDFIEPSYVKQVGPGL